MSRHASGNMEETIISSKRRRETSRAGDEEGVSLANNVREELERITKKYEDLVKKLRDKVECPVCFDVPRKPPVPVSFCPNSDSSGLPFLFEICCSGVSQWACCLRPLCSG